MMYAPLPDFRGEHGTEPVPPEPHSFVANINAAPEKDLRPAAMKADSGYTSSQ
jgi:hypothetical protein